MVQWVRGKGKKAYQKATSNQSVNKKIHYVAIRTT